MKHHIERTSPKGQPFIGTCRLCGKSELPAAAALEDCENVRGLSVDDALLETIAGRAISDSGMIGLSASERACYQWPDDTELHRSCRAAYIAGAIDHAYRTSRPPKEPVDDGLGNRHYPPGEDGIPVVGPTPRESDLVERLRGVGSYEAADEIERLREERDKWRNRVLLAEYDIDMESIERIANSPPNER